MSMSKEDTRDIIKYLEEKNTVLETAADRMEKISTRILENRMRIIGRFQDGESFDDLLIEEREVYKDFMDSMNFAFATTLELSGIANHVALSYLDFIKTEQIIEEMKNANV